MRYCQYFVKGIALFGRRADQLQVTDGKNGPSTGNLPDQCVGEVMYYRLGLCIIFQVSVMPAPAAIMPLVSLNTKSFQ